MVVTSTHKVNAILQVQRLHAMLNLNLPFPNCLTLITVLPHGFTCSVAHAAIVLTIVTEICLSARICHHSGALSVVDVAWVVIDDHDPGHIVTVGVSFLQIFFEPSLLLITRPLSVKTYDMD